jgi:hypothetical protein
MHRGQIEKNTRKQKSHRGQPKLDTNTERATIRNTEKQRTKKKTQTEMQRRRKNENREIRQREMKTEVEGKKEALSNQCTNRPQLRLRLQA